jgi:lipopolysaccharide biosynthesis glycosyltransferase
MSKNTTFKVFIGYDSREDIAYQVARYSLMRHTGSHVSVQAISQTVVREGGLYMRPADATASTEFSLTRFLTPYLAAQDDGWVLFTDCDFLFTADISGVFATLDPAKAVYVVQHEYEPAHDIKMDGQKQTRYPRKNWSSFVLFNCAHRDVQALTPDVVNSASPAFLHRFEWIKDQSQIGALDLDWNFLVGEYPKPEQTPRVIHYTNGGPWFEEWQEVDYADLWLAEQAAYLVSVKAKVA